MAESKAPEERWGQMHSFLLPGLGPLAYLVGYVKCLCLSQHSEQSEEHVHTVFSTSVFSSPESKKLKGKGIADVFKVLP